MKRAIYSSEHDAYRLVCPNPDLYLLPRKRIPLLRLLVSCPLVALEDIDKNETWLWLNEVVKPSTKIIYDRTARYYKVDSEKARRLSRLAEIAQVFLVDIDPFYEHRKFLYMTWRYVSRTILGYQHFYAFSGSHAEEHDGKVVESWDQGLLVDKIAPFVARCESPLPRRIMKVTLSLDEQRRYTSKKSELFAKYKSPQPIITRLADLSHGFESRRQTVCGILSKDSVVICNMDSYAKYYAGLGVSSGTYAKPPSLSCSSRIVFAEPPIVHTYRRFDLQGMTMPGTEIIDVEGDSKVDIYLSGRLASEFSEVFGFKRQLNARLSE